MPIVTIKVKARQYPLWHYAFATVFMVLCAVFYAWFARSEGYSPSEVRQILFTFGCSPSLVVPSLYFAYERRLRNHNSKAVLWVSSIFTGAFSLAILYFVAVHDLRCGEDLIVVELTVATMSIAIVLGLLVALLGIKFEVE